jgi:autotransporter-associated beta strand protein
VWVDRGVYGVAPDRRTYHVYYAPNKTSYDSGDLFTLGNHGITLNNISTKPYLYGIWINDPLLDFDFNGQSVFIDNTHGSAVTTLGFAYVFDKHHDSNGVYTGECSPVPFSGKITTTASSTLSVSTVNGTAYGFIFSTNLSPPLGLHNAEITLSGLTINVENSNGSGTGEAYGFHAGDFTSNTIVTLGDITSTLTGHGSRASGFVAGNVLENSSITLGNVWAGSASSGSNDRIIAVELKDINTGAIEIGNITAYGQSISATVGSTIGFSARSILPSTASVTLKDITVTEINYGDADGVLIGRIPTGSTDNTNAGKLEGTFSVGRIEVTGKNNATGFKVYNNAANAAAPSITQNITFSDDITAKATFGNAIGISLGNFVVTNNGTYDFGSAVADTIILGGDITVSSDNGGSAVGIHAGQLEEIDINKVISATTVADGAYGIWTRGFTEANTYNNPTKNSIINIETNASIFATQSVTPNPATAASIRMDSRDNDIVNIVAGTWKNTDGSGTAQAFTLIGVETLNVTGVADLSESNSLRGRSSNTTNPVNDITLTNISGGLKVKDSFFNTGTGISNLNVTGTLDIVKGTTDTTKVVVINEFTGNNSNGDAVASGKVNLESAENTFSVSLGNFGGQITGNGTLEKSGLATDTLTLTNAAPFAATNKVNIAAGTLALDRSTHTADYTFNPKLTGTGTLEVTLDDNDTKFSFGNTVSNAFEGIVDFKIGTITLNNSALENATLELNGNIANVTAAASVGTLNDITNGTVNLGTSNLTVGQGFFAGTIDGTGTLTKSGPGTTTLTLTNANPFTSTNSVAITGGKLLLDRSGISEQSYEFDQALTGSGILEITLSDKINQFSLGTTVGNEFTGTVSLTQGTIELDGNNTNDEALATATKLQLAADSVADVKETTTIGDLITNGGTLKFTTTGTPITLTVGTLDVSGDVILDLSANEVGSIPTKNYFDYASTDQQHQIIAATTVQGDKDNIEFRPPTSDIPQSQIITEGGLNVGTAKFNYDASLKKDGNGTENGVYLSYGLTEIEANSGKTVTLDATGASVNPPSLSAKLTGSGNFKFTGGNNQNAEVHNDNNSNYSGTTEVTGENFTVTAKTNNAFGNTSELKVTGATAKVVLTNTSQTVGGLSGDGTVTLGNLTVSRTTGSTIFAGVLEGTGSLTKSGASILTLSGTNTYNGETTINGGTLALTETGSIENSSKVTVTNSAIFDVNGVTTTASINELQGSATNAKVVLGTQGLSVAKGSFAGEISGTDGILIKRDNDTLTLSGRNIYSGETKIEGGTLLLTGNGSIAESEKVTIENNAILDAKGVTTSTSIKNLQSSSTNAKVIFNTKELIVGQGSFAGQLTGTPTGTFTKNTAGTLTLTHATPFSNTNQIRITEGTLALDRSSQSGIYTFNHKLLAGSGTLEVKLGAQADEFNLGNVGNAFTGTVSLAQGTIKLDSTNTNDEALATTTLKLAANSVADVTGNTTIGNLTTNGGTVKFTTTAGEILPGNTVLTVDHLDLSGNVKIEISGTINGDIATPLTNQSFFDYTQTAQQLIAATTVTRGTITLEPPAENGVSRDIKNIADEKIGTATFDYSPSLENDGVYLGYCLTKIDAEATKTVTIDAQHAKATPPRLKAELTGAGNFTFTGINDQQVEIGNQYSSYEGTTTIDNISGFIVTAITDNAFGQTSQLTVKANAKVDFVDYSQTVGDLDGTGEIVLGNLTVNLTADSTFGGKLSGGGSLTKIGENKLTLSGTNSYTGATNINDGTLALTGTSNITSSSGVNLETAGTFDISDVTPANKTTINALNGDGGTVTLGTKELEVKNGSFGGEITGTGNLTKIDSEDPDNNTLTLSGTNSYEGATKINTGTLALTGEGSIAESSKVTVGANAIFDVKGVTSTTSVKELLGSADANVVLGIRGLEVAKGSFAGEISGINGKLIMKGETNSDKLELSGTNFYTGETTIDKGILKLTGNSNIETSSSVTINTDGTFDVSEILAEVTTIQALNGNGGTVTLDTKKLEVGKGSFAGTITGTGTFTKNTAGTLTLTNDMPFTAGTTQVQITEGTLKLNPVAASDYMFDQKLDGTGTLAVTLNDNTKKFSFGNNVKYDFIGTVSLTNGIIELDGVADKNVQVLKKATLELVGDSVADVKQSSEINHLTTKGGTVKFTTNEILPDAILKVNDLNIEGGVIIKFTDDMTETIVLPLGNQSFFDYADPIVSHQLIAANGNIQGEDYHITLDSSVLSPQTRDINSGGEKVGTATFSYETKLKKDASERNENGVYLDYGLTKINAENGKTVTLDATHSQVDLPNLSAQLTGTGNFEFTGNNTVTIGNKNSSYTGTTTVTGTNFTVITTANNAFGNTSNLTVDTTTKVVFDGHSQKVGGLSGTGEIEINKEGTLTVDRSGVNVNYIFEQKLTGTGTLEVKLNDTDFDFSSNVGNAFTGTVSLTQGTIELDGSNNNVKSLEKATLKLNNSVADVKTTSEIGGLTTNGGTVKFTTNTISPDIQLIVGNLDINDGVTLDLTNGITNAIVTTPSLTQNFFDYAKDDDNNNQKQIIAATGDVKGDTSDIKLKPPGDSEQSRTINNGIDDVGKAIFNYNAELEKDGIEKAKGVYLSYGLTEITAFENQTVTLDATGSKINRLYAQLTGKGSFEFTSKDSNRSVEVGNSNSSYSGTTTVTTTIPGTNFTVNATSDNIFGNTSELTVETGATVDFKNHSQTVGCLDGNGKITNGKLTVDTDKGTGNSTFAGTLEGTTSLTKKGNNILTLSGTNTYEGATTIEKGTLALTEKGSIARSEKVTVDAGTTFDVSSVTENTSIQELQSTADDAKVVLGTKGLSVAKGSFNGVISEMDGTNGKLIKNGISTDELTLSNVNTYTGETHIKNGTLALTGNGSIANSSNVIVDGTFKINGIANKTAHVQELTGNGNGNVELGSKELEVEKGNFNGAINGNGKLTKTGTNSDRLTLYGTNNYTGATNINAGTLELTGTINNTSNINVANNAVLDVKGNKTLNNLNSETGTVTFNGNLDLAGNEDTTINGLDGTGTVTKTGTGTTTLGSYNEVGTFVQKNTAGMVVAKATTGTTTIDGNAEFDADVKLESELDVNNDLTLNKNTTLNVDFTHFTNQTGAIIDVDGSAKIDRDAKAIFNIEPWISGTSSKTYHLLSANSLNGTFDKSNITVTFGNNPALNNNRLGYTVKNTITDLNLVTFTPNLAVTRSVGGQWSNPEWYGSDDYKFYNGDYVTLSGNGKLEMEVDSKVETAGMNITSGKWTFNGNSITGKTQTGYGADDPQFSNNNKGALTVTGTTTTAKFNTPINFANIAVTGKAKLILPLDYHVNTGTLTVDKDAKLELQAVTNKVSATGDVTIDGDFQLLYDINPTQNKTISSIITTTGGIISGNFDPNISDKLLSSAKIQIVNQNQLDLVHTTYGVGDFAARNGLSGNIARIGDLINTQDPDSPLLQELYALGIDDQEEFERILRNHLSPELAADALQMNLWKPYLRIFNRLHETGNIYSNNINNVRGQNNSTTNYEFWFENYYRSEKISQDAFAGNYESSHPGMLIGMESRLPRSLRAGLFFGYGKPRVFNNIGRIEANDFTVGIYSRSQFGQKLFLNSFFAYGNQDYEYKHNNSRTSYGGEAIYSSFEFFQTLLRKDNSQLMPLVAVDFQKAWTDGFITNDTAQKIDKSSLDQVVLRIGMNSKFRPKEFLNFRTRLQYGALISGDKYGNVRTSFLNKPTESRVLTGVNLGRNMFNIGVGFDIYDSKFKNSRFFADYDFDLGERSTAHSGQLGIAIAW